MALDKCINVVDTSSWLLIQEHPMSNRILDALTTLMSEGRIKPPPEVFNELKTVDAVTAWVRTNKRDILENRSTNIDYLMKVGEVASAFPGMTGVRGKKNKADPYIVALAALGSPNPGEWTVVCDETLAKRPGRKLPTACGAFGVDCIGMFELLRREFPNDGW